MAAEPRALPPAELSPHQWLQQYCPVLDGQFLFLDPISWRTFQLSEGAVTVLQETATAIELGRFSDFLVEVQEAGGWPPELEPLAWSLNSLIRSDAFRPAE